MYQGAIIGLGNVALGGHLPGWQRRSEFRIVAGVDSEPKRWKLLKEALPAAANYSSISDLPPDLLRPEARLERSLREAPRADGRAIP